MSEDHQHGEFNRPRRPNPDTVAYLKSLPLSVRVAKEEIDVFLTSTDSDKEFPPMLTMALAALDQIVGHELASLAGDEEASQIIEQVCHICLPHSDTAARLCLYGLATYHLHLSTHRYASHVVQTILTLAAAEPTSNVDLAIHEDSPLMRETIPNNLPSLAELVTTMVQELSPMASQLAVHVCGSHVLRTLVCVLGGVEIVVAHGDSLRRGKEKDKKKKKKKKRKQAEEESFGRQPLSQLRYLTKPRLQGMQDSLLTLTEPLFQSQKHGELQQMACHASAGPLLATCLRVMTYASVADPAAWQTSSSSSATTTNSLNRLGFEKGEPIFELDSPAHQLVERLLLLEQSQASEAIYGLSGEPRGSHVLETILRISPDSVYQTILTKGGFVDSMQDYVEHFVANFCIQTLFATVRNKEQAQELLSSVERLITNGFIIDADQKRIGIFWRAVEMSAKYSIHQESILKALRIGTGFLGQKEQSTDDNVVDDEPVEEPSADQQEEDGTKKKKQRQKSLAVPLEDCIPALLNISPPEKDGDRVKVGVEGTRAVHHLLRFNPRLCDGILKGIVDRLSATELELLAKDGLGSRCIWDGILEGPIDEAGFQKARRRLLTKLSGRWVAMASDRVAHHSVKKLFGVLNMSDKETLVAELAQGMNRLSGSSMGRSVAASCSVAAYLDGKQAWTVAVGKMTPKSTSMDDFLGTVPISADQEASTKKPRKRKRKRGKEPTATSVDSIINTISNAIAKD